MPPPHQHPDPLPRSHPVRHAFPLRALAHGDRLDGVVAVEVGDAFVPGGLRVRALGVADVAGDGGEVAGGEGGGVARGWDQGGVGGGGTGMEGAAGAEAVGVGGGFGGLGFRRGCGGYGFLDVAGDSHPGECSQLCHPASAHQPG